MDSFVCVFRKTYDSTISKASQFVRQSQQTGRAWEATVLEKQIHLAWHPLVDLWHNSPSSEISMETYENNGNFFSVMISQERLLSKYLSENDEVKLQETRIKLIELYDDFPRRSKSILVGLGLDVTIGTLITLPLHRAVRLNDAPTLTWLLQHRTSFCLVDYLGRTAVHVATESNAPHMLSVLLSFSKESLGIDSVDVFGKSPLYLGVQASNVELARKLLTSQQQKQREDSEWSALLTVAAESGCVALVRILLLAYGGDLSLGSKSTRSAGLIAATSAGHLDVVRLFVAANADLHIAGGGRLAALDAAIIAGHCRIISYLLGVGSNVNGRQDYRTKAPIHHAVEQGGSDVYDLLVGAGADANAPFLLDIQDKAGRWHSRKTTAIEFASETGNLYAVRQLLGHAKVTINRRLNAYDRSPLELAAKSGHESVVDLLLSYDAHVNIFHRRLGATTPLLEAVSGGHLSITRKLIAAGADVNASYSRDKECYEPVSQASPSMYSASVENVMAKSNTSNAGNRAGCNPCEKDSNESCIHDTALQLVAKLGHVSILQVLLEAGAAINTPPQRCGGTALQYAALKGHLDIVEVLLGAGAAVGAKYGKMTALQAASKGGYYGIAELLLRQGAQVDEMSPIFKRETPLRLAAKGGHLHTVRLLLDWHADINGQFRNGGATPLEAAACEGDLDVVQLLLNTGTIVDARPGSPHSFVESTALQAAASGDKNVDLVRALLAAGADPNALPGADGFTALGNAVVIGNLEMTRTLLTAGAHADIAFTSRSPKLTALQATSKKGHVVSALFGFPSDEGSNVSYSEDIVMTAIQMAARLGHYELVSFLLEAGANVNGQPPQHRKTALNCSLEEGYEDIAKLLIEAGANVNAVSGLQFPTALQIAAKNGLCASVDRLLCAGANVDATVGLSETALVLAIRYCRTDIVCRLLEANANINIGHPLEEATLKNQVAVVKLLLDRGADVKGITSYSNDWSLMETAVWKGHLDVVQLLLDTGTELEILGYSLVPAVTENYLEIANILLAAGADPNAADREGHGALIEAAAEGHQEFVCLLLGAGVDPNTRDEFGSTALHRAAAEDHSEIAMLLLIAGADTNCTTDFPDIEGIEQTALDIAIEYGSCETARILRNAEQGLPLGRSLKRKRPDIETESEDRSELESQSEFEPEAED